MVRFVFITLIFLIFNPANSFSLTENEFTEMKRQSSEFDQADKLLIKYWKEIGNSNILDDNSFNQLKKDQINWIKIGRDTRAQQLINNGLSRFKAYAQATQERALYLSNILKNNNINNNINISSNISKNNKSDEFSDMLLLYMVSSECSNKFSDLGIFKNDNGRMYNEFINKYKNIDQNTVNSLVDSNRIKLDNIMKSMNINMCAEYLDNLNESFHKLGIYNQLLDLSIKRMKSHAQLQSAEETNIYLTNMISNECIREFVPNYYKEYTMDEELDRITVERRDSYENRSRRAFASNEFDKIKNNIDLPLCVKTLPITISHIKNEDISSTYKKILSFLENKLNNVPKTLPKNEFGLFGFYEGENIEDSFENIIKLKYAELGIQGIITPKLENFINKYKDNISIIPDDENTNLIRFIPDLFGRDKYIIREINKIPSINFKVDKRIIDLDAPSNIFNNSNFIVNNFYLASQNKPKMELTFISDKNNNYNYKLASMRIFIDGEEMCKNSLKTINNRFGEELNDMWIRNNSISTYFITSHQKDNIQCTVTFLYPKVAEDLFKYYYETKENWYQSLKREHDLKIEREKNAKEIREKEYMEGM